MTEDLGVSMLKQRIVPYVEAKSANTAFSMAFLVRLFELRGRQVPASIVDETYSRIIGKVITQFDLGAS